MSPMALTAAWQAASAFLPGPCSFGSISAAPRSLASSPQAMATSPPISAAKRCTIAPAAKAPFTWPPTRPPRPKFALNTAEGSEMSAGQLAPGTPGTPGIPLPPQSTSSGTKSSDAAPAIAPRLHRFATIDYLLNTENRDPFARSTESLSGTAASNGERSAACDPHLLLPALPRPYRPVSDTCKAPFAFSARPSLSERWRQSTGIVREIGLTCRESGALSRFNDGALRLLATRWSGPQTAARSAPDLPCAWRADGRCA